MPGPAATAEEPALPLAQGFQSPRPEMRRDAEFNKQGECVQRGIFDHAACLQLQRLVKFNEHDITNAQIFLDESDHCYPHWDPEWAGRDIHYSSVSFTYKKSCEVRDAMFGGEGTPWTNVRCKDPKPGKGAEVVAISTGEACDFSDSRLHHDGMHHMLVAVKSHRTVFVWEAALADGACPLKEDMPAEEFATRYKELGFARVRLEEGDVMLLERHRAHRVLGSPSSSAVAFAVKIQHAMFDEA